MQVEDAALPLDNNRYERAIRLVVMRKTWLFAGLLQAGKR